jgi:hypothetical protein
MNASKNVYIGDYMYTSDEATPFEAVLTMIGDTIIKYETERYEQQRLVAFFNWPSTDPFEYPEDIMEFFKKSASVDVEHILTNDSFISGQFASYHAYPYYPGYLNYYENKEELFTDENGELNTYTAYLKMLKEHHTMPVVITEFGIPSARGMAHEDANKGYNQGRLSEEEQGLILVDTYNDILSVDLAGCLIYMWQDDWTRSTWNTQYAIDTLRQPYWSDYQTSDQFYGILTFDSGEEESICYTDGNTDEWTNQDIVSDNGDSYISMKYDEKFIYFLVYKSGYSSSDDIIYIPVDTTQKSGSLYCSGYDVRFERAADFLIVIDGTENSRVVVQERYDVLRAMYNQNINGENPYSDPPDVNSPIFKEIRLILQLEPIDIINNPDAKAETYETGILTYGNGNPDSDVYNSLSDYIISGDYIEIRIPWELFNYSDPSKMMIHDDYYQNYGVESISIDTMYIGVGTDEAKYKVIRMDGADMKRWDTDVTYHERLKSSYYMLQEVWTADE